MPMQKNNNKHKMTPVPTAYEEHRKIINSKTESDINNINLENKQEDETFILNLINTHSNSSIPITNKMAIERATYQEAIKSLIALQNPEVLEAMMLLYAYMYEKKTFKLDKITGTELLNFGGFRDIRQKHRHNILSKILQNEHIRIKILDPEKSIKNYKKKSNDDGLVYTSYDLLRIKSIVYSKRHKEQINALMDIEFLPEYINHIHKISKRYLPLESILSIPKDNSKDKTRHFLYRLCFKFAGMQKNFCELNLEECMNIGQFFNKERSLPRKWYPIEKALIYASKINLIKYEWNFKKIKNNNFLNESIVFDEDGYLDKKYHKYIKSVSITRLYSLNSENLILPIQIEKEKTLKPSQRQKTISF